MRECGIREVINWKTSILAIFGIRTIEFVYERQKGQNLPRIALIGVPPWRSLRKTDLSDKYWYELRQ